jgi:hypothetical protein
MERFESRAGGARWKASKRFHVALEDSYVRRNWDEIDGLCKLNGIPFEPTGEHLHKDGHWCVYQFATLQHAVMFWDRFKGRWLRQTEFVYPDRPGDIPKTRSGRSRFHVEHRTCGASRRFPGTNRRAKKTAKTKASPARKSHLSNRNRRTGGIFPLAPDLADGVADDPRRSEAPKIVHIALRHQLDQIHADNMCLARKSAYQRYHVVVAQARVLRDDNGRND